MTMIRRKRILYCEGNVDGTIGGSFYSLLFLVEGLDRLRYEPMVIFHRDNTLIPAYRNAGIDTRVFALRSPVRLVSGVRWADPLFRFVQRLINVGRFFLEAIRCALFLKRHRIDLLHLNNSITRNHHWMLGAMLARIPCITHERGINAKYSSAAHFFGSRLRAIVCISGAVRDALVANNIRSKLLVTIYNGLDVTRVLPQQSAIEVRQREGITPTTPVIGIVGNIKEWKGQEVVIRATARLRERWPDIRCFLVGDASPDDRYYLERINRLVRDLGLESNVIFTGYRKNVADYMNAMDVVVHASVEPEPFGRVLIEAMAIGKPIVASGDGAVTEIVLNKETGFTFPPGNDAALAAAIETLLNDPALAREMGRKSTQRVEEEFNISQNVKKTEALYHAIFCGSDVTDSFACRTE